MLRGGISSRVLNLKRLAGVLQGRSGVGSDTLSVAWSVCAEEEPGEQSRRVGFNI